MEYEIKDYTKWRKVNDLMFGLAKTDKPADPKQNVIKAGELMAELDLLPENFDYYQAAEKFDEITLQRTQEQIKINNQKGGKK